MKKVIFLVVLSLLCSTWAAIVLGPEGFEDSTFPPTGWVEYTDYPDGWERSDWEAHDGIWCALHYDETDPDTLSESWLVTEQFSIDIDAVEANLIFWEMNAYLPTWYEYHGVWISTGSGDPADGDFEELEEMDIGHISWTEITIDLLSYVGEDCYIAFKYMGDYMSEWYLDDIYVKVMDCIPPVIIHMYKPTIDYGTPAPYSFTVQVFDPKDSVLGVEYVQLCYDVDEGAGYSGTFTCVDATEDIVDTLGNGIYIAEVPEQPEFSDIKYYFIAADRDTPDACVDRSPDFVTCVEGNYYCYDYTDIIYTEWIVPNWRDMSDATFVGNGRYVYWTINLPFDFKFYGETYDRLHISSNGWISFTRASAAPWYGDIISSTAPNATIAWWWGYLDLLTSTVPTAAILKYDAGDTFFIEVKDVQWVTGSGSDVWSVQIALVNQATIPNTQGDVIIYYKDVSRSNFDNAYSNRGPTIGIENGKGTIGIQYSNQNGELNYTDTRIVNGPATLVGDKTALKFTIVEPELVDNIGYIAGTVKYEGETDHSGINVELIWEAADFSVGLQTTDATGEFCFPAVPGLVTINTYTGGFLWSVAKSLHNLIVADDTQYVDLMLYPIVFADIYFSNFDLNDGGLIPVIETATIGWEWGEPGDPGPSSAWSPDYCWGTDLDAKFKSPHDFYLFTPVFNFSDLDDPRVSHLLITMQHWYAYNGNIYATGAWGYSGGNVSVSTDLWTSYELVPPIVVPYPCASYAFTSFAGERIWTSGSSGPGYRTPGAWTAETLMASDYIGARNAQFRFRSGSHYSGSGYEYPGWYIDDLGISVGLSEYAVVKGHAVLKDRDHHKGIAVHVGPFIAYTADDGSYECIVLPSDWDAWAFYTNLWSMDTKPIFTIEAGETLTVDFVLEPKMGFICGTAVIEGFEDNSDIYIFADGLTWDFYQYTDFYGGFCFPVAPDDYDIYATYTEWFSTKEELGMSVAIHETVWVDFKLREYMVVNIVESDFEDDDGGFTELEGVTGGWQWGTPTGISSSYLNTLAPYGKMWGTNISGNWCPMYTTLGSPFMNFTGLDNIYLTFDYWHYWYYYYLGGNVKLSTDFGASWTIIVPQEGYPPPYSTGMPELPHIGLPQIRTYYSGGSHPPKWVNWTFDLSEYIGRDYVRVRWDAENIYPSGCYYAGWYVDNIRFWYKTLEYGIVRVVCIVEGEMDKSNVKVTAVGPYYTFKGETDSTGILSFKARYGDYNISGFKSGKWSTDTTIATMSFEGETVTVYLTLELRPFVTLWCPDFDEYDGNMVPTPAMFGWEFGSPSGGPGSAYEGENCWATILGGKYGPRADMKLVSPVLDLSLVADPTIVRFWHWYDTDWATEQSGGGNIKGSVDDGFSWDVMFPSVGAYDEILPFWWTAVGGEPGFTGKTPKWIYAEIDLTDLAGENKVRLMWHFGSDTTGGYGWAIDNVCVEAAIDQFAFIYGIVELEGEEFPNLGGTLVRAASAAFSTKFYTNPDGSYKLFLLPGSFDISVSYSLAFSTANMLGLRVEVGDTFEKNFELRKNEVGYATGYVKLLDKVNHSGIKVNVLSTPVQAVTQTNGFYTIGPVLPGNYAMYASMTSYSPNGSGLFTIASGGTTWVDTIYLYPIPCWSFEEGPGEENWSVDNTYVYSYYTEALWQWGSPNWSGGEAPSAHSGKYCWATNLTGGYRRYSWMSLEVELDDEMTMYSKELNFWSWYDLSKGYNPTTRPQYADGICLKGSIDEGATWFYLYPEPAWNYPHTFYVYSYYWGGAVPYLPLPGNWGSNGGWEYTTVDISEWQGELTNIQFGLHAYAYNYDYYGTHFGWAIDDVCFAGDFPIPEDISGCIKGYVYDAVTLEMIPHAKIALSGQISHADAYGYFVICDVDVGYYPVYASARGYMTNFEWGIVPKGDTYGPIYIPLSKPEFGPETDPTYGVYDDNPGITGLDDQTTFSTLDDIHFYICNPYDHTVTVDIYPYIHSLIATDPELHTCVDSFDLRMPTINKPWGIAAVGMFNNYSFWISSIEHSFMMQNVEVDPYGVPTGRVWGTHWLPTPYWSSSTYIPYPGDMTYDGTLIWQLRVDLNIGESNLYGWDPVTGVMQHMIVDPYSAWNRHFQNGLAYDPGEDVFYLGGWQADTLYKIAGLSYDEPGMILGYWSFRKLIEDASDINAGIAGIGFNHTRRTVWIACRNFDNEIIEFDPEYGVVLNTFLDTFSAPNNHCGAECDAEGRFWIVSSAKRMAYAFMISEGTIPPGVRIEPTTLKIPAGACEQVSLVVAPVTEPGIYQLYLALSFEGADPIIYPVKLRVSPYANYGWNMISIPVDPDPNSVYAQLSDNIVPLILDIGASQFYKWNTTSGAYCIPYDFGRGEGYILFSHVHDKVLYDISGMPYYSDFVMNLPYGTSPTGSMDGFNLVGNPVNTKIDWDAIVDDPMFYNIEPTYYVWSTENGFAFYTPGLPGGATRYIQPYQGFWVEVLPGGGILAINEFNMSHTIMKEAVEVEEEAIGGASDFTLRISVANGEIKDKWNYLGTRFGAEDGFDGKFDAKVPPYFPSRISTSDLGYFVDGPYQLSADIKKTLDPSMTKEWIFDIKCASAGTNVEISWPKSHIPDDIDGSDGTDEISSSYTLTLRDERAGGTIDMRTTHKYSFEYQGVSRRFVITVNKSDTPDLKKTSLPDKVSLLQNNPNPFNFATDIEFYLPEGAEIALEIYSVEGKLVRTLAKGEYSSGKHFISWDGMDETGISASSGIYIAKLKVNGEELSIKMSYIK